MHLTTIAAICSITSYVGLFCFTLSIIYRPPNHPIEYYMTTNKLPLSRHSRKPSKHETVSNHWSLINRRLPTVDCRLPAAEWTIKYFAKKCKEITDTVLMGLHCFFMCHWIFFKNKELIGVFKNGGKA